jgi:geranylgeranyl diphosphate synthase type I
MSTSLTPRLLEGEMLDVQFSIARADELTEQQILHMLSGKSAALLEYAAWAGATIGLGDSPDSHDFAGRLARFAVLSGVAFQLQDDLLGLTADESKLGKPVGSDLREGKRTLILHRALLSSPGHDRARLASIIGRPDATPAEAEEALAIIRRTDALEYADSLAHSLINQALHNLESLPHSRARQMLASLADFVLARSY